MGKPMTIKKQRGKDHWTIPYTFVGKSDIIHVWMLKGGTFMVYCGAVVDYNPTFEEAVERAKRFANGGAS